MNDSGRNLCTIFPQMLNHHNQKISLSGTGKLQFYSNITNHNQYALQNYLTYPIKKMYRSYLTKLRISALPRYIETGRYTKPPVLRTRRWYYSCKILIENEPHFVLYCNENDQFRSQYTDLFNAYAYSGADPIREILNPLTYLYTKRLRQYLSLCFSHSVYVSLIQVNTSNKDFTIQYPYH